MSARLAFRGFAAREVLAVSLAMAEGSLFRRSGSPNWQAAYTGADGRRVYRSTGTTVKGEAREILADWVSQVGRSKRATKRAAKRAQDDLLAILERGARLQAKGWLTREAAMELLEEMFRLAEPGGEALTRTVKQWVAEWLAERGRHVAEATLVSYRASAEEVLKKLGSKAKQPLQALTTADCERVQVLLAKGKGRARTVNRKMAVWQGCLERAARLGYVARNVMAAVDPLPERDSQTVVEFSVEEVTAMLEAAVASPWHGEEWRGAILLAAHTGLRRGNVAGLEWKHVDLERRRLVLPPVKQRRQKGKEKVVEIPMTEQLAAWLQKAAGQVGPVFPSLAGNPQRLSEGFKSIMRQAEVPAEVSLPGGEQGKRSFHSLRHTFVTWLADAQIPEEVRQVLAAHSDRETHKLYTHVAGERLEAAVRALPTLYE